MSERRFPIMGGPSVPWSLVAPYAVQAKDNHDQSLERLAERGGLDPCELWCIVHSKRLREKPDEHVAKRWLREWLDAHEGPAAERDALRAQLATALAECDVLRAQLTTALAERDEALRQARIERGRADLHVAGYKERDAAVARAEAVEKEREAVAEAALLPIRRALFLRGHCGDGGLAPMVERALDEARQRGRDDNRQSHDALLEASDAFPPDMEGTVAARVGMLLSRAEAAERERAAVEKDRRRDLDTIARHEAFMREQDHQIEKAKVREAMALEAVGEESAENEKLRAKLAQWEMIAERDHGLPIDVINLRMRLHEAERERDEALADGVLSQRMCDVLNERDAYRAMVCDLVANNSKPVGDRAVWDRARDMAKHGPQQSKCEALTEDGRRCLRVAGHESKQKHQHEGIEGETCTCMLRWHPNRCKAHPENNG